MKTTPYNRRQFLTNTAKASASVVLASTLLPALVNAQGAAPSLAAIGYTQQPLPYAYGDLQVAIDAQTMEIHFTKHAAGYAKNLSEAIIAEKVNPLTTSLEQLLGNIGIYSPKMRNNAGGHYNHEFFWQSLTPQAAQLPTGKLLAAINQQFGSVTAFQTQFSDAAKSRFGSGWAWLVLTNKQQLAIGSTPNQDNPLMPLADCKGIPLLGLDVWEHAYYLRYQNKRADYITNFWKIVNWPIVEQRYLAALR